MIKLIIFDLDLCIWDPYTGLVVKGPFIDILTFIEQSCGKEKREKIGRELFKWGLPGIIKRHKVPIKIANKIKKMYVVPEAVPPIKYYPDVMILPKIKAKRILVTTGLIKLQESKIRLLRIRKYFDEIIINSMDNTSKRWTKKKVFKKILKRYRLKSKEVMVIGDSAYDELQPAKDLGMVAVQSLRSKVRKVEGFSFYIHSFKELPIILKKIESP